MAYIKGKKILFSGNINMSSSDDNSAAAKSEIDIIITPTEEQQVVEPTGDNVFNKVTVEAIPSEYIIPTGTLEITENGTHTVTEYESVEVNVSGGGSEEETTGQYHIKVIDYDGTILKQAKLDSGATFTLPTTPDHDRLVFQEWSSPVAITDNQITVENSDITIGAIYTTASGLSEFDIALTPVTGLVVTLNIDGTKDWGDGTSDTATTHTYSNYGDYTITCDGSTMTASDEGGIFGQTSSTTARYICRNIRFGNNITTISSYALFWCLSLSSIVLPNNITSIDTNSIAYCRSLANIVLPTSVTKVNDYCFYYCYSLANIVLPSNITSIGRYSFTNCYSLTNIMLPNNITSIGSNAFYYCYSLTNMRMPKSLSSIKSNAFYTCSSVTKYDFSQKTTVVSLSATDAFSGINGICKIIVPDNLYDTWIAATNWSTYANYIYKASEVA